MVATFEVYEASETRHKGEIDYYSILGLSPSADRDAVKKQYKKKAVLLHPDKNKCVGADGAFKLVSEAWTLLSDKVKKRPYNLKRNKKSASGGVQTSIYTPGVAGVGNCTNSPIPHSRLDTFWTVCTSCKVQYEYLRKYVNKRLSCKNCRGTFVAVESGSAPISGSFPYSPWSYMPTNGHGSHGYDGVTYVPTSGTYIPGNGISGYHSSHGYEHASNVSFQWNTSGASSGITYVNGMTTTSTTSVHHVNGVNGRAGKSGVNKKHSAQTTSAHVIPNLPNGSNGFLESKTVRAEKKRKVAFGSTFRNVNEEKGPKSATEATLANGNVGNKIDAKLPTVREISSRGCSTPPAFDARKLLIDKARMEIRKKLEDMKLASEADTGIKAGSGGPIQGDSKGTEITYLVAHGHQLGRNKNGPITITVPDSDFHDFDKDRSEECFKPKQIWALYDEDDGMPRLYCLIREIVSVEPFKIHISYLNSKTDSEFGTVNWVNYGFTKSCGHFRAWNSDIIDQVNIFSHLLKGEKAGRGGCVRIFPKSGSIWAMYRNWSEEWDRSTPDAVRHQYEMVEVLDDYAEDLGVCVAPLVKLDGFKTVYQRNTNKDAIRWIPRREMIRFSHQVPSCLLKGGEAGNLPEHCWDLDPAATPEELLNSAIESTA